MNIEPLKMNRRTATAILEVSSLSLLSVPLLTYRFTGDGPGALFAAFLGYVLAFPTGRSALVSSVVLLFVARRGLSGLVSDLLNGSDRWGVALLIGVTVVSAIAVRLSLVACLNLNSASEER